MSRQTVKESALAKKMGVPRGHITALRRHLPVDQWGTGEGGAIVIHEDGIEAIEQMLAAEKESASDADEGRTAPTRPDTGAMVKKAAEQANGEAVSTLRPIVTLYFWKPWANACWCQASTEPNGQGELARVRIKRGTKNRFIRNMEMPCHHIEQDRYECTSMPKRRGRW